MYSYQLKAIRKNEKPPVWRRIIVPSNITFAQLAAILESALEYAYSDEYMFEFYSLKKRLIEWKEGRRPEPSFYFSYFNAPDVYINEWMNPGKAFSFNINGTEGNMPKYRIEIEKILDDMDAEGSRKYCFPIILKQVLPENDIYWSKLEEINRRMKQLYFTVKSKGDYLYIAEIIKRIDEGNGITCYRKMKNRNIYEKLSTSEIFGNLVKTIDLLSKS